MEILFKGFIGPASNPVPGWFFIISGIILCLVTIVCFIKGFDGGGVAIFIGIIFLMVGCITKAEGRVPIIKATIDETTSWQEINDKYKLLEQTGKIYTFEVKNTTIEEWENLIKEENEK